MKKSRFATRLGIAFLVLAVVSPLFGFLVPFLGLPKSWSAALIGFLIAGAPEIFLILGGLLAGKEVVTRFKNKLKGFLKK